MDYEEMARELDYAGIDPFEFYLMDEDERREVLRDAFLDPDDFEYFDIDYRYSEDYGRTHLPWAAPVGKPASAPAAKKPAPPPAKKPAPGTDPAPAPAVRQPEAAPAVPAAPPGIRRYCYVEIPGRSQSVLYLAEGFDLRPGDRVEVPVGATNDPVTGTVRAVCEYAEGALPNLPGEDRAVIGPAQERPRAAAESRRQTAIAQIDRKMDNLRAVMEMLVLLLVVLVGYVISREPGGSAPTPTPTSRATPMPTSRVTPKPAKTYSYSSSVPHVGMSADPVPYGWIWMGDDYLTVRDSSGGKVKTTKYYYYDPPKSYTIWVNERGTVVKVSITDPTDTAKPRSTAKPKKSSSSKPAKDYVHPEDFYEYYYDDFWDYEDAEDYWEEWG